MRSPKTLARIAGLLYLVGGVVELIDAPGRVVRKGAPTAAANALRSSAVLFRVAVVSDLVAAAMVTVVATGTAVSCLDLISPYAAVALATNPVYVHGLGEAGADTLTYLYLAKGAPVDTVFFGLWLFPLGYLVFRSGYLASAFATLLRSPGSGPAYRSSVHSGQYHQQLFPDRHIQRPAWGSSDPLVMGELRNGPTVMFLHVEVESWHPDQAFISARAALVSPPQAMLEGPLATN